MHPSVAIARAAVVSACLAIVPLATAQQAPGGKPSDRAEALAREAQRILDAWDGQSARLEAADKLLQEALRIEPGSSHALAEQARRVLLAGTEEEGIRPSALQAATGLANRAFFAEPRHPRAMAMRGHVYTLRGEPGEAWKSLKPAEMAAPDDPWIKLYFAEYHEALGDQGEAFRYLEESVAAGLPDRREALKATDKLLAHFMASGMRGKADAMYAQAVALDPGNPLRRGDFARQVIIHFLDFETGARIARETLKMSDHPNARQTLSLALYGRWAHAARQEKGPDVLDALFREAAANDPDGRQLPGCLANWPPLRFVFERLEARQFRREGMHRC